MLFLSPGATTGSRLRDLILECIKRLSDIGIIVKVVVCDQGANNRALFSMFSIIVEQPFIEYNGTKTYFMYDPPHLLKSVRNNFRRYPIQFNGGVAKWEHVECFYDRDSQQKIRLAPKLKLVHLLLNNFKKMNVKLAAQVLSHSAAAGICCYVTYPGSLIPPEALATAEFIEFIDN